MPSVKNKSLKLKFINLVQHVTLTNDIADKNTSAREN